MHRGAATIGSAIFLVLAPGGVAVLMPWWISRWRLAAPFFGFAPFRIIGAVLIVAGLPVLLSSFARFVVDGLGTPAPIAPPRHLVVAGLYRYVRNPMYVAVVWLVLGQGLLLGSLGLLEYGLVVWAAFHAFVLGYEEPTLRSRFGAEYDAFCENVGRWIPRRKPWTRSP